MVDIYDPVLHVQVLQGESAELGDTHSGVEQYVYHLVVFAVAVVVMNKLQELPHLIPGDGFSRHAVVHHNTGKLEPEGILLQTVIIHRHLESRLQDSADRLYGAVAFSLCLETDQEQLCIGGLHLSDLPAAEIHTHGKYDKSFYNNEFSGLRDHHGRFYSKQHLPNVNVKDVGVSNTSKIISYVVTPNGSLQKYNPYTNKITVISNDMPSDVNDPNRLNKNNSLIEKNPMDISDYLKIWRKIITDNYE